jgi:hypothetical protein
MNAAYEYGQRLAKVAAEPWSVLRAGLTHGAQSAIPGAVIGGALGYGTAPKEYTGKQRMLRAGKGALAGGAVTGTLGGGFSALQQKDHVSMFNDAKNMATPEALRSAVMSTMPPGYGNQKIIDDLVEMRGKGIQEQMNKFPRTWAG